MLIGCTAISLLRANFYLKDNYIQLWDFQIGGHSSTYWINDGLMKVFFLLRWSGFVVTTVRNMLKSLPGIRCRQSA
ncbi:MAG: Na+/H+ antiporter NhaA [Chitinophagales bacterium]|nr:Na+/H+ antiporter NhaA [Chitinophagales bacterium]